MSTTSDPSTATVAGKSGNAAAPVRGAALGHLVRRAKPALLTACAAIDAAPEFAASPDRFVEARILRKLGAYRDWLVKHDLRPAVVNRGVHLRSILRQIGHPDAEITSTVRAEMVALEDLLPSDGSAFRGDRGDPVDLLIDDHVAKMRDRKRGLPRNGPSGRFCWLSTAEQIGCSPEDLTETRKSYLRAIDVEIGVPDESVDVPFTHWDKTPRNAAVPELLEAALKARRGRMPADPLHPTMIDIVTIAEEAGVTVRDIAGGPLLAEHRTAMEDAREGKPLVAHPLLAGRRFTYREMKEWGRAAREAEAKEAKVADPAGAGRMTVRALTRFLDLPSLGGKVSDLVPLDFPDRVRRAIASRPAGADSGWASQISRWIDYYAAIRSEKPLPAAFATAARILAAETGVSVYQIIQAAGHRALNWMHGLAYPTVESDAHVGQIEKLLRVLPGTLTKLLDSEWRSHRLKVNLSEHGYSGISHAMPKDIASKTADEQLAIAKAKWEHHVRQETEYAKRLSHQIRDPYRLPFDRWPTIMQDAWTEQTPELNEERPQKQADLRLPGDRPAKEERSNAKREEDRSWRPHTGRMAERMLGYFFGYLVRPRATDAAEGAAEPSSHGSDAEGGKDEAAFVAEPGLGMPGDLVHPSLLAVIDLLTDFSHWRRRRSGGRFASTISDTLAMAADFLKPKTGIVWRNKSYLRHLERFKEWWDTSGAALQQGTMFLDIDAFREDWHAAVEAMYDFLIADVDELRSGDFRKTRLRAPFVPIAGYLREHDPMVPYMAGVRAMLDAKPLGMVDRHLHARNCILTLIVLQTGLRAATLLLTVSGKDPTLRREVGRDGNVTWRIVIPANRFKNARSPFFQDGAPYEFTLDNEDDLYERLDDHMARGRPYLLAGKELDALFITREGNAYTAAQLSNTYRLLTGRFFVRNEDAETGIEGVLPHGLHAVRHIIATSLLRTTGDIYVAAWAIQDTARTVEQHYVEFLPRNKAALAVEHLRKSRALPPQAAKAA